MPLQSSPTEGFWKGVHVRDSVERHFMITYPSYELLVRETPVVFNILAVISLLRREVISTLVCRALRNGLIRLRTPKALDGRKASKGTRCKEKTARECETHFNDTLLAEVEAFP